MAHNVLVVGFGDRVFNFPVTKAVEASTLRGWLDQRLVCVNKLSVFKHVFTHVSINNRVQDQSII